MSGIEALVLLLMTPLVPLGLALAPPRWRRDGRWQTTAALAALPALVTSALMPAGIAATLPWLLEGSEFGLDVPGRLFLFFSSAIWLAAGLHARTFVPDPERSRFFVFFLFVMSGNLGLIVARDILAFYLFFVLMSFGAYGLIVHGKGRESRRAGRIYMSLVVAGDMLLFAALVLSALEAGGSLLFEAVRESVIDSPWRDTIFALVVLGFGVKLGLIGLHVTLPLIYRAAPIPAAAVLAGAVLSAGLLAWLRFLPFGTPLPGLGALLIPAGIAAAFYGAVVGVLQREARAVLGYSSVSQMGVMTAGVGAAAAAGLHADKIIAAVVLYAMHHAFAKSALFLGLDWASDRPRSRWRRAALGAGLLLPAVALTGAPFTSGMLAKEFLKESLAEAELPAVAVLATLLPWTALATTLIVARFLWLAWPRGCRSPQQRALTAPTRRRAAMLAAPWAALWLLTASAVWLLPIEDPPNLLAAGVLWETFWPLAFGVALAIAAAHLVASRRVPPPPEVPPGDVVVIAERGAQALRRLWIGFAQRALPAARDTVQGAARVARDSSLWPSFTIRVENLLGQWSVSLALFIALAVLLAAAAMWL
ncbi:MAG: hypothetical protein JXB36_08795 [Gammaproteobacteria bacterium]|nr:hypothetical protein [Gammaproteobacteria bacterium]